MHTIKISINLHGVTDFLNIASASSMVNGKVADTREEAQAWRQHRRTDIRMVKDRLNTPRPGFTSRLPHFSSSKEFQSASECAALRMVWRKLHQCKWFIARHTHKKKKKLVTEEIQSVFTGQLRTSSMAATGSLLYRRHWLYGGERVLVKALPATWWEIPARPQHLHGSAET